MARKNCPDCGGFLKQGRFSIFRCTKCENRHWYRRFWRWCQDRWARTTSAAGSRWASIRKGIGTYWPLLIVAALFLAILFVGLRGKSELEPLQARVTQLEETVADLEEATARLESQADSLEAKVQVLEESVAHLEQTVAENTAAIEQLQRLVEELLADEDQWESCQTQFDGFVCTGWIPPDSDVCLIETCQQVTLPEQKTLTVHKGDTVWDLLTQELGRYPTWEEIQKVVDANGLSSHFDSQGRWIVLIYPGQVLDLSPALGP